MDINNSFASTYIKASDLQGQTVKVQIKSVVMEVIDKETSTEKAVMYFVGKEKGVVVNFTKANVLKPVFGSETDNWIGQTITLVAGTTTYKGEIKPCINFGIVPMAPPAPPPATPAAPLPSTETGGAVMPVKESFTAAEADEIVAAEVASADVGDGDNVPF